MPATAVASRPRWIQVLEYAAALLVAILAAHYLGALRRPEQWLVLAVAAPAGYLLADLCSGLAHWFGDTFFEENTPVLGPLFIAPFREHHRDPLALTRHSFGELNGSNCLGVTPLLAAAGVLRDEAAESTLALFGLDVLLSFSLSIAVTNQIHCWAHSWRAPGAVRWLQRHGLILMPERHLRHHQHGSTSAYCVTTGWMNRVLDESSILLKCERALRAMGLPKTCEAPES
jgi:ubiquitin-conjugating enzyme E2 variant